MSSLSDEKVFSEVKRLCCSGFDGLEFLQEALECVRRTVPFEGCCATTTDPSSGLITHGHYEEMGGEAEATLFFERHYFDHQVGRLGRMTRECRPVELLSEDTGGKLERSVYYRELLVPLGYAHRALGAFTAGGTIWGSVDLARETGRPDFTGREVALLKRLAPHVGNGLKAAALRSQAFAGNEDSDAPGVLTLDGRGRVIWHTPIAKRWLRQIGDLEDDWQDNVPMAIRVVSGALKRALRPETDRDLNSGVPRLRVRARSGRWLTLYASLTEPGSAGNPGETVVVIEPARPEEVGWLNASAYGLSPRKEEVVKLVVRGASTKEISQQLFVAEYTVQRHLSNVFEKVGVRGRRALVKRLFLDNLYPRVFG